MPLPDINFRRIRLHEDSQDRAFEELCCQLAASRGRAPGAVFTRKGRGRDGGVECLVTFADGSETGWQVKYSWAVDANLKRQLDASLDAALKNHPRLDHYIVGLPFDPPDPRAPNVTTQLDRWNAWVTTREAKALAGGRNLKIERWDASVLKGLLTADETLSGRILFWFDDKVLTPAWFKARLEKSIAELGPRYSNQTNIDLPIRRAITAASGDPDMRRRLGEWAAELERARVATRSDVDARTHAGCTTLRGSLAEAAATENDIPVAVIAMEADTALSLVLSDLGAYGEYDDRRRRVSGLADVVTSIVRALRRPEWMHINNRRLLLTGEAGRGKSHLLADACAAQIAQRRPAVLLLGGQFTDDEVWSQVRNQLDLPVHVLAKDLLGALDSAGFAAGCRTLLVIDALNERHGQDIWPDRLVGLLHDAEAFSWVSVVVSCRDTYLDLVIPPSLDETRLPRLEHEGFGALEAEAYLEARGIDAPAGPFPIEEFSNPLFLKTCCDGLEAAGQKAFPRGSAGVSALFDMYAAAVDTALVRRMRLNSRLGLVAKAIEAIAQAMAAGGLTELPYRDADLLVEAVHSSGGAADRSLTFQLENEGVLVVEPVRVASGGTELQLRFTFERFADHVVARGILDRSVVGDLLDASRKTTELAAILKSVTTGHSRAGVLEAMAVQVPERYGIELLDLDGVDEFDIGARNAFELSLRTREGSAFTARTLELVERAGGQALIWETLLGVASEPDNPFNAQYLDTRLRALTMPERDASWSVFLASQSRAARMLIDWAWRAGWRAVEPLRAELAATALAWLLTTSDRQVRDRATKALVSLLALRADLAKELLARFLGLDDAYVSERVMCAVYGAAMQGRWSLADLGETADLAFEVVLSPNSSLTPNVLTRDHALGLVGYAGHHAALPASLTMARARPPYRSVWPIEPVPDAVISTFTRSYLNRSVGRDEIVRSCVEDGDFARYVLDPAVRMFSPASRGTTPLPTNDDLAAEWLERFRKTATAEMLDALGHFEAALPDISAARSSEGQRAEREARARFVSAVGDEVFESWREVRENWRAKGMYQAPPRSGAASFNLAWARRWVAMRAHQLGWSEALHGEFDLGLRGNRHEHRVERIGKKYQWIALYELRARMLDNLAVVRPDEDAGEAERLRNIDPSLLLEQSEELRWSQLDRSTFWVPAPDLSPSTLRGALAWLDSDRDFLDGAETIAVTDPDNGRPMLVLSGFAVWEAPCDRGRRDMWRRLTSIVVRRGDCDAALGWMSNKHLTSEDDLPSGRSQGLHGHLGEHAWVLSPDPSEDFEEGWASHFDGDLQEWKGADLPARGVTSGYLVEATGFDQSITESVSARLPAPWLMSAMGLGLVDGRSFAYADSGGVVRAYDPTAKLRGHSAALVDRESFEGILADQGLVCIWAVGGEKNIYGDGHGDGFGGRVIYTRLHVLAEGVLTSHERFRTLDRPSFGQLRDLARA
jgi:hypothetical protein